uniref:Uncharacterized protein n=1 Tax=Arundo donax TaxID=35708 RepID=A0A0A9TB17_ARUDO
MERDHEHTTDSMNTDHKDSSSS